MSLANWTFAYRLIFVAFLVVASAMTIAGAHGGHFAMAARPLASAEIVAALLFLFRRTQRLALAGLLAVFTMASVMAIIAGEMPLRFVYYAATAAFIVLVDRRLDRKPADASQ
jgi:hypothetical protein